MKNIITININGKPYETRKGEFILDVARRNQIIIPTLCHHEGLNGLGCCRLCIVEVNEGWGNKVVISCAYPINQELAVFTESEKIQKLRRIILSMLKDLAPNSERISSLCSYYHVESNKRFNLKDKDKCIICGLCVKACDKLGTGAIGMMQRGIDKKVTTPYDEESKDCIGCLSCANVCPTKAINFFENRSERIIWNKTFKLIACEVCGKKFATKEEYLYAKNKSTENKTKKILCSDCKRKNISDVMAKIFS